MISENQFLIGHLSPKLFNHLGINEIYQDPRQNFSLNISHNAIPRPLINTVTLQFLPIIDFMIGLPSTSPRPDSIWIIINNQHLFCNYTLFTLPRSVGIHLDHIVLYLSPKATISNISAQLLAHFLGNPLQSSPGTKLIRSSAYHPRTDGQTEKLAES